MPVDSCTKPPTSREAPSLLKNVGAAARSAAAGALACVSGHVVAHQRALPRPIHHQRTYPHEHPRLARRRAPARQAARARRRGAVRRRAAGRVHRLGRRGQNAVEARSRAARRRRRPEVAARLAARRRHRRGRVVPARRRARARPALSRRRDEDRADADRSRRERPLSQVAPVRLSVRGVRVPVPRQPPSRDRVRGAVPRLDRRRQRASARSRAALPRAQRRGGDPRAQPSVRRRPSRARPTARSRCACATRSGSSTCACSITSSSATAQPISLAERGWL